MMDSKRSKNEGERTEGELPPAPLGTENRYIE